MYNAESTIEVALNLGFLISQGPAIALENRRSIYKRSTSFAYQRQGSAEDLIHEKAKSLSGQRYRKFNGQYFRDPCDEWKDLVCVEYAWSDAPSHAANHFMTQTCRMAVYQLYSGTSSSASLHERSV